MMIDLSQLSEDVVQSLRARSLSNTEIAALSPRDAFVEYCQWKGFADWGGPLWDVVEELQMATVIPPTAYRDATTLVLAEKADPASP
jgi:hypothetical protein